jgi:hypothetical protein
MKNSRWLVIAITILISTSTLAVERGFTLSGAKWNPVIRLQIGATSCSASLVSDSLAITAAHCFDSHEEHDSINAYYGAIGNKLLGDAQLAYIDPRYSQSNWEYDVAIVSVDIDEHAPPVKPLELASAKTYKQFISGSYPLRIVLAVGYGLDENNDLGIRKAAFEDNLSLFPLHDRAGQFFTDRRIGETKPGDSGGPILIATEEGSRVFGVVSGNSVLTYEEEGEDERHAILTNAPAIPSLCIAPQDIRNALNVTASLCSEITTLEEKLYGPPRTPLIRLWKLAHALESPFMEIAERRSFVERQLVESFKEIDSLLARRYFASRFKTSWNRDNALISILSTVASARGLTDVDQLWANDQNSKDTRTAALIRLLQSANKEKLEACGEQVCYENFRAGGGIRSDTNRELWDPITSNLELTVETDEPDPTHIASVLCAFIDEGFALNSDFRKTRQKLNDLGFRDNFIGISRDRSYTLLEAENSKLSFELHIDPTPPRSQGVFLLANVGWQESSSQFLPPVLLSRLLESLERAGFTVERAPEIGTSFYVYETRNGNTVNFDIGEKHLSYMAMDVRKAEILGPVSVHDAFACPQ